MADELPKGFPPGTELTGALVDKIVRELWRWRKFDAAPPLAIDYADSDEPPQISQFDAGLVVPAKNATGSTIAAGTYTTPVKFTATFLVADTSGGPGMVEGDDTDAYNQYPGTISNGALLYLVASGGYWYVLTAGCT